MQQSSIVIIGLGRVGSRFLEHFLEHADIGISIVGVVEPLDTLGKRSAQASGIAVLTLDQVIEFAEDIDLILEFSGDPKLHQEIRQRLDDSGNTRTEVASENTLSMMWRLMSKEPVPVRS